MLTEDERYIVVQTLTDGTPLFIDAVASLTDGKKRLKQLAAKAAGAVEFYVYDLIDSKKVISSLDLVA